MTEAELDASVEDKLACEHEKHLRRQEKLLDAMTRLQQLGTLFVREGELEPVLGEIVDAAIAISGANFGNIQILDPKSSELKIMAHRGFPEWWIEFWNSASKGKGACGTALEQGARIIVDDVEQSPIFIGTPALEIQLKADVRAVQSTPLVSRSGRPLGVFSTHYKTPHRPDDHALRLLDLLALQAADIIERAQADEALRKSEARLRRIAEAGHIGIFEWDASKDNAYWSPEHYELFGFEPGSQISWQRWLQGVHPDDRERVVENAARLLERARSEGQVQGHKDEYRFIRSEGSVVWLEADLSVDMVSGEPIIRGSVRDITERKRAEESEERLRALMDHNPSLIFLKDESGRYVYLNKAYERQFALSKDWYGKTDFDFWPKESAELFRINDSVVLKSGQIHQFIEDSTDLEGIRHCWHCYKFPFVDSKNERYVGGIGIDATDRIRAEEELRLAYARLQTFFDHRIGGIGIVIANAKGSILQANDYYLSILGYTREELLSGQVDWRKMTPPEWLPADERALAQLQEQGVCNTYEKEYIRRDGTRVPVLVTDAKMPGDSGDILAFVFDIIERKKAEEALRKSKDELEQRVQERTADLVKVNEELMAAKEAAEASVRAKAAFLANMSHELRTPLNSIMGFTNLLLEEPLPVEYKDWLDTMKINSEALLALINDVLDFSKMEKDKVELENHPFNLRQRIEESLDLVSAKAAEKGLDLAYIMYCNVPETIISDSARLRQVLANLLSNAVKFTDVGDVLVHVTSKQDGELHEIHFAVQDTGIGMPQSQMSKLFQPFSQINTAPSRLTEGTGLGLAISRKLVELMGGKIWAESEEGKGSTFIFTIKAKAAPDDKDTRLPARPQPQLTKRNVLIVEDSQTMRRFLGHHTKSWGMVPLVVSLSYSANELIQNGVTPDVAIIDASMPDLNGIVLAQMIRRHRRDLPLIIMTTPGQHIPQNLLAINLPKPIKPTQLYDALTNMLEGRPIQGQYQALAANQTSVSSLRILLAEDNVSSQQVAMGMLKKLGYKADVAANGVEVIQALERQHYDVVLIDIKMPEMDGLEATRIIRQRWPDNGPKIIAITAYAIEGDREKFIEAGMDDYISKPVQKEDLAEILSNINHYE